MKPRKDSLSGSERKVSNCGGKAQEDGNPEASASVILAESGPLPVGSRWAGKVVKEMRKFRRPKSKRPSRGRLAEALEKMSRKSEQKPQKPPRKAKRTPPKTARKRVPSWARGFSDE